MTGTSYSGSKAGSDRNPDWYHNLLAHPDTQIEVGDLVLDVHAEQLTGQERDARFQDQAQLYPGFAGYQQKTKRVIPVVALTPTST
jgi:deazaflavin-dependent oxidoreductase (nitroreductase family)